ncbi:acetyl-CoA C-acyltransferase [Bordetella bronchiseptica D993]|nr:acetyl-CoA C-acyltransferase [Bordetella bronchiseptica D993]
MSVHPDPVVIVAARRTPIGAFQGALAHYSAPQLGAHALAAAVRQAGLQPDAAQEALMGCCLFAGLGQAPARQAVLGAGLPTDVQATTLSKMCGSGMKAAMLAHDMLRAGSADVVLAGGMESMSNAPHLIPKARQGYRLGDGQLLDHMYRDGLQDAYEGRLMGHYADLAAREYGFSREQQDAYAHESVLRAQRSVAEGEFAEEIAPIAGLARRGAPAAMVAVDETPGLCDVSRLASLKPVFNADGTVTAGNASSISDGAAALVLTRQAHAERLGLAPQARIVGHATAALPPGQFPAAPVRAIARLFERVGWDRDSVDLFEINEAFAVVTMIALRELGLPAERVNVNGGACALGHPVGATGARLIVTLMPQLLSAFRKDYPRVDLVIEESTTVDLLRRLDAHTLDVALVRFPVLEPSTARITLLQADHLMLAVPAGSRYAQRDDVALDELADEPFIGYSRTHVPGMHALIMYAFQQYGVVPHIAQEAIQVQTILSLVESGLGLAIVPKVACRQAGSGVRLVNVPQLAETIKVGIALAVHPDNATPTTANFVDMACRLMQTEPAAGQAR